MLSLQDFVLREDGFRGQWSGSVDYGGESIFECQLPPKSRGGRGFLQRPYIIETMHSALNL